MAKATKSTTSAKRSDVPVEAIEAPPLPAPKKRRASTASTVKKTLVAAPADVVATPTSEDIRVRAYHLYLERGGSSNDPVGDWVRAEFELTGALIKA